jgi:hypothetical protein
VRGTKYTYTAFAMSAAIRLLALLLVLPIAACVALGQTTPGAGAPEEVEPDQAVPEQAATDDEATTAKLPELELTEPLLYEILLAEIALQRGNTAFAAQSFADLAERTRDPRIARRAVAPVRARRGARLARGRPRFRAGAADAHAAAGERA